MGFFILAFLFSFTAAPTLDDIELTEPVGTVTIERYGDGYGLLVDRWCHATNLSPIEDIRRCLEKLREEGKPGWVLIHEGDVPTQLEGDR